MQLLLERHPEILAYLVDGHHGAYVVPQVSLGKEFVPDFFVAGQTSAGIRWTLVELESPTASLSIADGQASSQLRKAVKQITDWREWLADNADYARRGIKENGLGLPGIRHDARGLIAAGTSRTNLTAYASAHLASRTLESAHTTGSYEQLAQNVDCRLECWTSRQGAGTRTGSDH